MEKFEMPTAPPLETVVEEGVTDVLLSSATMEECSFCAGCAPFDLISPCKCKLLVHRSW